VELDTRRAEDKHHWSKVKTVIQSPPQLRLLLLFTFTYTRISIILFFWDPFLINNEIAGYHFRANYIFPKRKIATVLFVQDKMDAFNKRIKFHPSVIMARIQRSNGHVSTVLTPQQPLISEPSGVGERENQTVIFSSYVSLINSGHQIPGAYMHYNCSESLTITCTSSTITTIYFSNNKFY
jgi:hypothetical protein